MKHSYPIFKMFTLARFGLAKYSIYPRVFKKRAILCDRQASGSFVCRSDHIDSGLSLNEDAELADVNLFGIPGRYAFDNLSASMPIQQHSPGKLPRTVIRKIHYRRPPSTASLLALSQSHPSISPQSTLSAGG